MEIGSNILFKDLGLRLWDEAGITNVFEGTWDEGIKDVEMKRRSENLFKEEFKKALADRNVQKLC